MAFNMKKMFGKDSVDEYVEIDLNQDAEKKEKIKVRPFVLKSYDDINEILDTLREGYTIAIIDIKYLKSKDVIELKRSVTKIKKLLKLLKVLSPDLENIQ